MSQHRPIFTGLRFVVFQWTMDDLRRMLGPHFDGFDVRAWFAELDARTTAAGLVVPQRDGGAWLLEQALLEAMRRGLPVATASSHPRSRTAGNLAAIARAAGSDGAAFLDLFNRAPVNRS